MLLIDTVDTKEAIDKTDEPVSTDSRRGTIVGSPINPEKMIFKPARMAFGGFRPLVLNE